MVQDEFYCLNKRCERQREQIIEAALKILSKITSLDEMRQYVYDGDLDGRDLLTFIWEYKIKELLTPPLISALVKEIWNSPYKITGHIFNASSIHVMTLEWRHNKYDMEQALRFYKWPEKDVIKSINSHWF